MKSRRPARLAMLSLFGALLAGCGGSGGGTPPTVAGRIQWEAGRTSPAPERRVALRVQLHSLRAWDGPSEVLAERIFRDVPFAQGAQGDGVPFEFRDVALRSDATEHFIQVTMDATGDGYVGENDYISEALNTVPRSGRPPVVRVLLTRLEACGTPGGGGYCVTGPGRPFVEDAASEKGVSPE